MHPAADMPRIAMQRGAVTVEINLEDTPVSHLYQHRLRGTASDMLGRMAGADFSERDRTQRAS